MLFAVFINLEPCFTLSLPFLGPCSMIETAQSSVEVGRCASPWPSSSWGLQASGCFLDALGGYCIFLDALGGYCIFLDALGGYCIFLDALGGYCMASRTSRDLSVKAHTTSEKKSNLGLLKV